MIFGLHRVGGCCHQTLDPHRRLLIPCIITPILHHHNIIRLPCHFILTSRTANSALLSIISYHHRLPLIQATMLSLRPLSLTTILTCHLLRLYLDLDLDLDQYLHNIPVHLLHLIPLPSLTCTYPLTTIPLPHIMILT